MTTTRLGRRIGACLAVAGAGITLATAMPGDAAASTIQPFQIQPAPFGNPNGSFDAPAIRCGLETGTTSGRVTVTGTEAGRWGCPLLAHVRWLNLQTGATGAARLSAGLNGHPAEATISTGRGQVVVVLTTSGVVTPGFATVTVR